MELFSLDQSKELDIIFLGRVAIDFNPAYSKEVKKSLSPWNRCISLKCL